MVSRRKIAILIGLYLSKFDDEAINAFGFRGPREAFNTLGYAIGVKPASIKNYRDEFDPYFSNSRKGWRNRPIRDYCKVILDEYQDVDFESFTELIRQHVFKDYEVEKFVDSFLPPDLSESAAKRMLTGRAAEEFFRENYFYIPQFELFTLKDTTLLACGFDFKLDKGREYYCVEVKGLREKTGTITLTEKEYEAAKYLRESYVIYVVSNFVEKPTPSLFFNPLQSSLKFKKTEKTMIQTIFSTNI